VTRASKVRVGEMVIWVRWGMKEIFDAGAPGCDGGGRGDKTRGLQASNACSELKM
jgi:hypothetical protein